MIFVNYLLVLIFKKEGGYQYMNNERIEYIYMYSVSRFCYAKFIVLCYAYLQIYDEML